jgi:hypothetical protein
VTHDYSRTKTALVGCLGVMVIAIGGLFVSLQRVTRRPPPGPPCLHGVEVLKPLVVGDSTHMTMGTKDRSGDCGSKTAPGFVWTSSDTTIATVTPDGFVRARAPGVFRLTSEHAAAAFFADGFVVPRDWQVKLVPENGKMRVGDTLKIAVRAFTKSGTPLPVIPFELHTPESFDPMGAKRPIVNRLRWLDAREPVPVVAIDTGTTVLIGRIGFQQATGTFKITK